jgi:hypothetical protein
MLSIDWDRMLLSGSARAGRIREVGLIEASKEELKRHLCPKCYEEGGGYIVADAEKKTV